MTARSCEKAVCRRYLIAGVNPPCGGGPCATYRGIQRTGLGAYFVATADNLLRIAKLVPAPTERDADA